MRTTITLATTVLVLLMGFHPADADNALLPLRDASAARFRLIDPSPAAFGDVADRQAVSTAPPTLRLAQAPSSAPPSEMSEGGAGDERRL